MASYRQRSGKWQARVTRGEIIAQKSFHTKRDAERWARQTEIQIDRGEYTPPPIKTTILKAQTLGEILERYLHEMSGNHRSNTTKVNIRTITRTLGHIGIEDINARNIAQWRDSRLETVKPATVSREINTLSAVLNHAKSEWEIELNNPIPHIKRPIGAKPRTRRLEGNEEALLLAALKPEHARVISFAIATGMRRGEILALEWANIDFKRQVAFLPVTKNSEPRYVPLSIKAIAVLKNSAPADERFGKVFKVHPECLDRAWRRACKRTGIAGLRVHDLRREAVSRFFEQGLSVPEVAAISGHKTLSQLQVYTRFKAEDLAQKLG